MTSALMFLHAQKQKTSRFPVDNLSSFLAIQLFHCQFVWHYSPTHVLYNSEIWSDRFGDLQTFLQAGLSYSVDSLCVINVIQM